MDCRGGRRGSLAWAHGARNAWAQEAAAAAGVHHRALQAAEKTILEEVRLMRIVNHQRLFSNTPLQSEKRLVASPVRTWEFQ